MESTNFEKTVSEYHGTVAEFVKGNPEPAKEIFSRRQDASFASPFGGIVRGWQSIAEVITHNASVYREGTAEFESIAQFVSSNLAFMVEVEKYRVKLGGRSDPSEVSLRVTSIFRLEDGAWKLTHRHADPLITAKPMEAILKDALCVGSRCYF